MISLPGAAGPEAEAEAAKMPMMAAVVANNSGTTSKRRKCVVGVNTVLSLRSMLCKDAGAATTARGERVRCVSTPRYRRV